MGLFRRKKKKSSAATDGNNTTKSGKKSKNTKKSNNKTNNKNKNRALNSTLSFTSNSSDDNEINSVNLGDIPRSISTTTNSSSPLLPPPTPRTPNREGQRDEEEDSIGSPCEAMRRMNQNNTDDTANNNNIKYSEEDAQNMSTKKLTEKLQSSQPSIQLLPEYMAALTTRHAPDTSGDLPSRALRALFALSENKACHEARVLMVRPYNTTTTNSNDQEETPGKLIPTLLTFLQRCPKDSSEQYLSLLVLNNLSIPMENKALVGLECGAVHVLGRMLVEDVGCHLLVIVIVNLTFCHVDVRKELLLGLGDVEEDGEVELIDCLAYALMLSSITTEQLSTLGPIPLTSYNGTPHTPHQLLSILRSTLTTTFPNFIHNNDDYNNISPPLLLSDKESSPFPETARWCLCALKNLTRPGKLSSSCTDAELITGDGVAARAIIDAGLMPILLRVIRVAKKGDTTTTELGYAGDPYVGRLPDEICNEGCVVSLPNLVNVPTWTSNSAQDAALYTLMHMASNLSVRDDLLRQNCGVGGGSLIVDELKNIVECGLDGVGVGDKLLDVVSGDGLVADVDNDNGVGASKGGKEKETNLGWLALHCIKARMSLSYLFATGDLSEKYDCSSYLLLAEHEAHSFVELLSHCLENRSKEGPGGYSAATFTLKGVLHSIRCLLSVEPGNRAKFASINGARLNSLLLKVVARYSILSDEVDSVSSNDTIDNDAVEDAVVSLYYMSQVGFHESVCMSSNGQSAFLPAKFGKKGKSGSSRSSLANCDAKDIIVKVLTVYIDKIDASTCRCGRHSAIQLMLRASLLRFEGEVSNLTYVGKRFPSRMDFDFDHNLLAATDSLLIEKETEGVRPKPILFGRRQIARYERYGRNKPKVYPNPMIAAEDIANRPLHTARWAIDDIAIANDISSCAEGMEPSGEAHGYIWKWYDGSKVLVEEDAQSEDVTNERDVYELYVDADKKVMGEGSRSSPIDLNHRGLLGKLGNLVTTYDDEPISIFGFKCAAPRCGRNTAV